MSDTLRVLYVDDDDDIRTVATLSLRLDTGLDIRTASSGAEALEMLAIGDWRPDVILLDVMMPGMNGPSLHAVLRERSDLADAKFIYMTARAQQSDRQNYLAAGVAGVIIKPFEPMRLAQDLRSILVR